MNQTFTNNPSDQTPDSLAGASLANRHLAESLAISHGALKSFWEIYDFSHKRLDGEFKNLKEEAKRLASDSEALKKREADAKQQLEDAAANLSLAEGEKREAAEKLRIAEEKEQANAEADKRIKPLLDQEEAIKRARQEAIESAESADIARNVAKAERTDAEKEKVEARELRQEIDNLLIGTWPQALSMPEWTGWRKNLCANARTTGSAALVLAAFHYFCAAEKSADSQELQSALQDLGKRLYADVSSPDQIEKISEALTLASGGKFKLKCPKIGTPTDPKWMEYKQGVSTIQRISNWAVLMPNEVGSMQNRGMAQVAGS